MRKLFFIIYSLVLIFVTIFISGYVKQRLAEKEVLPVEEEPTLEHPRLSPSINLPAGYKLSALYIAPLAAPVDIEITPQGDLLVAENGLARIRKVAPSGEVSTYVTLPQSATALAYNAKGELFAGGGGGIYKISSDGKISIFCKTSVSKMVLGPDGAFYEVGWHTGSPDIKKITPQGKVTTFATGLSHASDIAFSPSGELYVADPGSQRIVKVNANGTMTTLVRGLWTDPVSIVFDKRGNLFVAGAWVGRTDILVDMGLYKVSVVDGSITPVVLIPNITIPFEGMAIDDSGNIYGATVNHGILYKISPLGKVEMLVEGWHDGFGMAIGPNGDLFVADRTHTRLPSKQGRIFKLDMNSNVALFADGLGEPMSLAFDAHGNMFVAEMTAGRVLKITPEGQTRVLYQTPKAPRSITFDPISGDLFAYAVGTDEILRITPAGASSILPVKFDKDVFDATLAADGQGNILIYVVYVENFGVGPTISDLFKITPDGRKTFLAHFVDEVPGLAGGIAVSPLGDSFLLAHSPEFRIRKVTPEGNVSIFADNLPIDPLAIAMNKEGDIFFTSSIGIFKIYKSID